MAFIFVTLLIDVIGFGLVIPVLPKLVQQLAGGPPDFQARTLGWLLALYGLMQFVFAPVLGNLSDRYGRRPVWLLALLFTGADYILQAMAPGIEWLFVGRILAGIFGASFTAATAYIADVTPPEKRAQNFGMIGAAFGVGFIIGPAIGGLLGAYGLRAPFWAAAVVTFLNLLYGTFVLPESLSKENRRAFDWKKANPFGAFKVLNREAWVLALAGAVTLVSLAGWVPPSVWVLFTSYRFGWDEQANGLSLALLGLATFIVQMFLIRVLSEKLGDIKMLAFGLAMNVVGFVLIGASAWQGMLLVSMVLWTLAFVTGPALQGIVSRQYGPDEQGAVQGALTGIQSLTGVIGPPIFTAIFGYFTGPSPVKVPGAPFFVGGALALMAALLAKWALRDQKSEGMKPAEA